MLRYTADLRSIAFVLTYFALIAIMYALPLSWAISPLMVVVISLLSFFCAVITHNTIHAPVFHKRWHNQIFQIALSLCYGHPVSAFVPGHNLSHHMHTQKPADLMRTYKLRFRWNLLNQLLFSYVVTPAIFRTNAEYIKAMRTRRPSWFRQFSIETAFYVAFVLLTLFLDWEKFLLFVLIPHQFAAWGIMGINFVQHDGCDGDHPYNHSRNFVGPVLNWFCFNNGYHGLHHMKPALHWSLLPEVHAAELSPHLHPNLERYSLLKYSFEAYVWPGKRLRYDGKPVVLPPLEPDEPWIPRPEEHGDAASLGAM